MSGDDDWEPYAETLELRNDQTCSRCDGATIRNHHFTDDWWIKQCLRCNYEWRFPCPVYERVRG